MSDSPGLPGTTSSSPWLAVIGDRGSFGLTEGPPTEPSSAPAPLADSLLLGTPLPHAAGAVADAEPPLTPAVSETETESLRPAHEGNTAARRLFAEEEELAVLLYFLGEEGVKRRRVPKVVVVPPVRVKGRRVSDGDEQ